MVGIGITVDYSRDYDLDPKTILAWSFYALYVSGEVVRLALRRRLYGRFFHDDYTFAAQFVSVTVFIALPASLNFRDNIFIAIGNNFYRTNGFDTDVSTYLPMIPIAGAPDAKIRAIVAFYWISNTATVAAYLMLCRPILWNFISPRRWWWAAMTSNCLIGIQGLVLTFISFAPRLSNVIGAWEIVADALTSIVVLAVCYIPFLVLWRTQMRKSVRVTANVLLWIFVGVWVLRAIPIAVGLVSPPIFVPLFAWFTTLPSLHPLLNGDGRAWLRGQKRQRYAAVVADQKSGERHMSVETIQLSDFRRSYDDVSFAEDVLQTWQSRDNKDSWR